MSNRQCPLTFLKTKELFFSQDAVDAFRKQHLTTYRGPIRQTIFTEVSLQSTQRLYNLAKKDVEIRNRTGKGLSEKMRKKYTLLIYLYRKILYAVCSLPSF